MSVNLDLYHKTYTFVVKISLYLFVFIDLMGLAIMPVVFNEKLFCDYKINFSNLQVYALCTNNPSFFCTTHKYIRMCTLVD